ncbi:prolyl oligopeptidase family serine peptidase [Bacteroides sp. ET225]|uniref:S9 family peptidase n=1 Tax=Bacteroides sp. ET225 TaxID=2972461 RepID=UPI0021AD4BB6|nr:prolyl oligopeptidase family serine peptidase [Bacteroides sp. ET225]MCR8917323.1 prolyl oligopeptidase family serine peptidase [Bacteroides sp. ET225]
MKKEFLFACALGLSLTVQAKGHLDITSYRYAGPYLVSRPLLVDSTDVNAKAWSAASLLKTPLSLDAVGQAPVSDADKLPSAPAEGYALHLMQFDLENTAYGKAKFNVSEVKDWQLYVDGKLTDKQEMALEPGTHEVVLKYLSAPGESVKPKVSVDSDGEFSLHQGQSRLYTLADAMHGTKCAGVQVSPDGKYLIVTYLTSLKEGRSETVYCVKETLTGKEVARRSEAIRWMPLSGDYYFVRQGVSGRQLVSVSPATGFERVIAEGLPEGNFSISPAEDYLLYTLVQEGPKERQEIYEVIDPDDRQPGWRNRTYVAKYDLKSGLMQPLTFGYRNAWVSDISADGREALLMVSTHRMGKRPTTLFSVYRMDMQTLEVDTLVEEDGFISHALFAPDARQVLIQGSPEALGGVGMNVEKGQTPSMIDSQLFLMNVADRKVTPLTRTFNPSVRSVQWNLSDGQIYFTAENRDCYSLYRLDPSSGKITLLDVPEEMVLAFSLADKAPVMAFYGESAANSHRIYTMNLKKQKAELREDLSEKLLKGIRLGRCEDWNFVSSRGDTIYGRYYLPPYFDESKKYPMIVYYYGGCSPTSRNFDTLYPFHAYAAQGYVVYVVQPSGATGFGQRFSARHVNTFGDYVADDIIEGTKKFVNAHPYVNGKKIGCLGASYGGFMTQYLQTKTDIFAAAISHAGISDHTSYWGEGYWGYSYSEVSGANSYPWANPELFVDHSPLYNADKIHTPLLFLHGSVDTNVPVGESIQMYTALKLLGRETALVVVDGQNHHIRDYSRRILWQNTIFAWFAKWLQDDASWWNAMYPPKTL